MKIEWREERMLKWPLLAACARLLTLGSAAHDVILVASRQAAYRALGAQRGVLLFTARRHRTLREADPSMQLASLLTYAGLCRTSPRRRRSPQASSPSSLFGFRWIVSTSATGRLAWLLARCIWWNRVCHDFLRKFRLPAGRRGSTRAGIAKRRVTYSNDR
jgi:hypothetical protein